MAKLIVQHDTDPGIAIVLQCDDGTGSYSGECTECGYAVDLAPIADAQQDAEIHIDFRHEER
jgi:hypothetical protein